MMPSSVLVVTVFLFYISSSYSAAVPEYKCGENETSPTDKSVSLSRDETCEDISTMACDACLDCSPCVCKTGFIRASAGGPCISEKECHDLHLKWLHESKYTGKTNNFCPV